ncbi:MAG: crossover junction endodeoxyribonuclease RuvC [Spirochaetes bacterium]|nr:crossover junction endodeoxyribonuclease RuvC [Spirochaetota bacterium]
MLGIDPGYATLGWAVIDSNLRIIDYSYICTEAGLKIDERLLRIHTELKNIIDNYKPECLAIERLFFTKNTRTAIDVAKCIGVVLLTARLNQLEYNEYSPTQVKTAITGYGRASKNQIQNIIKKIYKLSEIPKPDDVADALAVAACHSLSYKQIKI